MNRFLSVLVAILITGSPAVAQTIVVRSGEHKDFTRLVVQLPEGVNWTIDQSMRSLALKVDAPTIHFDVSRVFDRIPRSRVAALRQYGPGSELTIHLACACSVSSFIEDPRLLVIDIKNSKGDRDSLPKASRPPVTQTPYRFPHHENPFRTVAVESQELSFPVAFESSKIADTPLVTSSPNSGNHERASSGINVSEERLLAQITRASGQGLIDLKVKPKETQLASNPTETHKVASTPVESRKITPAPISLSATTAIDRDLTLVSQSLDTPERSSICYDSSHFAFHDWGGSETFSIEIGNLRSQIFGEFDKVNRDTVLNIVRMYLHYGFGAEAAQSIDLGATKIRGVHILRALARLVDRGDLVTENPFSGQQHCDGDVSLWAVVSESSIADGVNTSAVLFAFSRLPQHLRSNLGPRISQKFAKANLSHIASAILRNVERTSIEPGSGIELAKAALAEMQGDFDAEGRELERSLASGSEYSPDALVKLVALRFKTRGSMSPGLPELAAAYALEFRNSQLGSDLRRTSAVALALSGDFVEAFATLLNLEKQDGDSGRKLGVADLLTLLSERADDVTFLRIALNPEIKEPEFVPLEVRNKMGRRLLDLGFFEQASVWVAETENPPTSMTQRLLRAEVALARLQPHRAKVELSGLTGPGAAKLLAEAMWLEGEYQQVGKILADVGDFDGAARGYWLAEEWGNTPGQADAHYAQVVARSARLRATDLEVSELTPLAEAMALMQNSLAARSEIKNLLQAVSVE